MTWVLVPPKNDWVIIKLVSILVYSSPILVFKERFLGGWKFVPVHFV